MKKDAYYLPHDSNAKDDPKITELIEYIGLEGYGIFWVLIEKLRDQPDYKFPLKLIPVLARQYNTQTELVERVVNDFGLFVVKGDFFCSKSLINRMKVIDDRRLKLSEAGKKGMEVKMSRMNNVKHDAILTSSLKPGLNQAEAALKQPLSQAEATLKQEKKSKLNKRKEDIFIKPTIEEVSLYCQERKNKIDPKTFLDYYETRGWAVGKNNTPMKDWRAAVRTWENNKGDITIDLGEGERITDKGDRTYGTSGTVVPHDAPPRPSRNHYWVNHRNEWEVRV